MKEYKASLHGHSAYSDGLADPTQLVETAGNHGIRYLALTDHNLVSGVPSFYKAAEQWNASNPDKTVIPIAGIEMMTKQGEVIFLCPKPLLELHDFLEWSHQMAQEEPDYRDCIVTGIRKYSCLIIIPHPNLKIGGLRSLSTADIFELDKYLSKSDDHHMHIEVHNGSASMFLKWNHSREMTVSEVATSVGWSRVGAADYHTPREVYSQVSIVSHDGEPNYASLMRAMKADQIEPGPTVNVTPWEFVYRFASMVRVTWRYHGWPKMKQRTVAYWDDPIRIDDE